MFSIVSMLNMNHILYTYNINLPFSKRIVELYLSIVSWSTRNSASIIHQYRLLIHIMTLMSLIICHLSKIHNNYW